MCVCEREYLHTSTHTHCDTHTHTHARTHTQTHTNTRTHTHTHKRTNRQIDAHTHTRARTHTRTHTHAHIHLRTHTLTHAHTHTNVGVLSFSIDSVVAMAGGTVRIDDNFFTEYLTNSCSAVQHDEYDEAHSGMTKTAREFLKKKFGTISRFYSNITTADTADINGFSRINTLRKALAALDRGGWERSYHQRIFHVSHCIIVRHQERTANVFYGNWCLITPI